MPEETQTKNIYQRIAAVMEAASYVQKTGYNAFHKYSYAKESDYLEALRPHLLKQGLVVIPSLVKGEATGDITNIVMRFVIVNVDKPEEAIACEIPGSGQDKGDKGVYKAITGAKKYFISTTFLIATGDDAEDDGTNAQAPSPQQKPANQPAQAPTTAAKPADAKSSFRRPGAAASVKSDW